MSYARKTQVPVEQTRMEIERTLTRYGARAFGYFTGPSQAMVAFEAGTKIDRRNVKIVLPLPSENDGRLLRQRWRCLLLVIKAKLESVESGIETLEQAFYANIVMPNGQTIYEATHENVRIAYTSGKVQALLPDFSTKPNGDGQ